MHRYTHTIVVVLALALAASACGSEDRASEAGEDRAKTAERVAAPQQKQELELTINEDGESVKGKSILLSGTVSEPGSTIDAAGKETSADATGGFRVRVGLEEVGENAIFVTASKPGFERASETVYVTRKRTAAELRAKRERERRRREQELASLRSSAQAIPPKQLQKDPDKFSGEKVVVSGQIFQIQEGGDNFFLMNTECSTEFDITICDGPSVYVTYDFSIPQAEEDLVTVYGTVAGGYEYDTQAGGTNYVAHVEAKIIE